MTKQFKYIEYEKLSDAVRDWENNVEIYNSFIKGTMTDGYWSDWQRYPSKQYCTDNDIVPDFDFTDKYAKRVEIKEKTVEAWGILGYGNCMEEVFIEKDDAHRFAQHLELKAHELSPYKLIKLTGTCKE